MIFQSEKPRVKDPKITAIMPCKGGADMVRDCLDSIAAQDLDTPYEVIVIDGWMDDNLAKLAESYDFVHLIRSDDNLLQAKARNVGVDNSESPYIIFIDSDCIVDSGWLRGAVRALDDGVRLAGGPVGDALPGNIYAVADNFSQFAELPETRPEGPQDHFPACNIAMNKEDFLAVGGFPHTGVPAGEDTLLCFAVSERFGAESMRFRPDMKIKHRGRETLKAFLDHQTFFGSVRGGFGIKLSDKKRRLGRYRLMAVPIIAMRLKFMLGRTLAWAPGRLPTVLKIMPLMFLGMLYWCKGFREACKQPKLFGEAAMSDTNNSETSATAEAV